MPFAGYTNFADCISRNKNKRDPKAYCAAIMHQVEGAEGKEKEFDVKIDTRLDAYGQTDYNKEEIKINPKRGDVVNTIIHEKLHVNYPEMPHAEVYKNADKIESAMTLPEMAKTLMEIHIRSKLPKRHTTEVVHTEEGNVIENHIK